MMRTPLLLAGLALALSACSDDATPVAAPETSTAAVASASPTAEPSPTAAPLPTAEPAPTAEPSPIPSPAGTSASSPSPAPPGPEDPLVPKPGLESPAPLGAPTCLAKDLSVVDADSIVTPATVHQVYVVRTSGPDCQLEGFPVVQLRGADSVALEVSARENGYGLPDERPATVTLSRSTSVSFKLGTARSGDCRQVDSVAVRLPGTGGELAASTFLQVCDSAFGISPVARSGSDH